MRRTAARYASTTFVVWLSACSATPPPAPESTPIGSSEEPPTSRPIDPEALAIDRGKPLNFALDPVDRTLDVPPFSIQLRGKRAIVILVATFDFGSLLLLRRIGPMLRALPPDVRCLIVARQPISARPLVASFLDELDLPCARAMGDPSRGRLGDLASITVVPATLVLRADGSSAGIAAGVLEEKDLRRQLDRAN